MKFLLRAAEPPIHLARLCEAPCSLPAHHIPAIRRTAHILRHEILQILVVRQRADHRRSTEHSSRVSGV